MSQCLAGNGCAICDHLHELFPDRISHHEWDEIHAHKVCKRYAKNEFIFFEGNWPKALYYVAQGKIKLYRDTSRGKKYILYIVGANDFIGYRSLLSEEKYAATAMTLEDSTICAIPKATLFMLLQKNMFFMKKMAKDVCHRMGVMEGKITDLAYSSVLERLSATLLMLRKAYGTRDIGGGLIDISLSREDLASIIGTATETVIRLLSGLKSEGIISSRGKKIFIEKPRRLTKLAEKILADVI